MKRNRWTRRDWDPDAFAIACRRADMDPARVEAECRMKPGRLVELADNGWSPFVWELARMSDVLGMSMDELYDVAFPEPR